MASVDDFQRGYLNEHRQVSARFQGRRCTIPVCGRLIEPEDDHQICGRCGRGVCATCSAFGVSRFAVQAHGQGAAEADAVAAAAAASDDGTLRNVCGECVADMVDRLGSASATSLSLRDQQVYGYLSDDRLPTWYLEVLRFRSAEQAQELEEQARSAFEPERVRLEQEILRCQSEKNQLEAEAARLTQQAQRAAADVAGTSTSAATTTTTTTATAAAEEEEGGGEEIAAIEAELKALHATDMSSMDENQAMAHLAAVHAMEERYEAAQLAEFNKMAQQAQQVSSTVPCCADRYIGAAVRLVGLRYAAEHNGKEGVVQTAYHEDSRYIVQLADGNKLSIKPENLELVEQPAGLAGPTAGAEAPQPTDLAALEARVRALHALNQSSMGEDEAVEHLAAVHAAEQAYSDACDAAIAEMASSSQHPSAAPSYAAPAPTEDLATLEAKLIALHNADTSAMGEREQLEHLEEQHRVTTAYEQAQTAALVELTSGDGGGGGSGGGGGGGGGGAEDTFNALSALSALSNDPPPPVNEPTLPLGLQYPTPAMSVITSQIETSLDEEAVDIRRRLDDEYDRIGSELRRGIEKIEDEVEAARAKQSNAAASVTREEELRAARAERRRREDAARRERERRRQAEEEAARRRRAADELATAQLFQRAKGDGGAAAIGERGDLRMCKRCKAGPVALNACADLGAHNDGSTQYKGNAVASTSRPNNCKNCDWFDADWHQWPEWDGVWGPH